MGILIVFILIVIGSKLWKLSVVVQTPIRNGGGFFISFGTWVGALKENCLARITYSEYRITPTPTNLWDGKVPQSFWYKINSLFVKKKNLMLMRLVVFVKINNLKMFLF